MFSNKIFISHTEGQDTVAEAIASSLLGRGYRVFLDKRNLPPGQEYNSRIEKEIKQSSGFIFLISPRSVSSGRYTRTELVLAEKKWPHPRDVVLPVMESETRMEDIPTYLRNGVTIYYPKGNVGAEVSHEMARLVSARNWTKISAALLVGVLALAAVYGVSRSALGPTTPYSSGPYYYNATARCTATGVVGRGYSPSLTGAESDAIANCEALGGRPGCCQITSD